METNNISYLEMTCNQLLDVATPLMEWIAAQGNPNITVIVRIDSVQAVECFIHAPTDKFIKD